MHGLEGMLGRLIGEHVTLSTELEPDLPPVRADSGQVEQVIVNLAVNARDAMPGGGRIAVSTRCVESGEAGGPPRRLPAGRYARLRVRDTGPGISPELRPRIFDPFFFTTKAPGVGTGLGLSVVYATLLLVEDEDRLRRMLEGAGYRVLEARDGEDALRVAASEPRIDLLVTDVVMPRMGGGPLAARLVRERQDTRVLFTSGYPAHPSDATAAPPAGAPLLPKPFTAEALLRTVRRVLEAPEPAPLDAASGDGVFAR